MNEPLRPTRLAPIDLLALGLIGIRTRKLRAALSALGIAIGIATMVIVTSIPAASQQALLRRISALGTNLLQVSYDAGQQPPVILPPEAVQMVARIGPVITAGGVANLNLPVARSAAVDPTDASGVTALASNDNLLQAVNGRVSSGRFLTAATDRFPTVVLGAVAADRLGLRDLRQFNRAPQIMVGQKQFTVIGVLAPIPLFPDLDRSALVGWDAAVTAFRFNRSPTVIYLKADEASIDAVRGVLPATVNPQLPGVVRISRPSDALAAKRASQETFSGLFIGLAGVALLVGGIGVANTMYISILERRREIGLRRALGANRGQIRGQFLAESAALSGLGGLAGTVIGVLATIIYTRSQGWVPVIALPTVVGGFAGAVVIGMVAGAYPSIQASRLTPTGALATT
jgi:putative ABC transport system permease protein